MRDVIKDETGQLHCWNCNGTSFTQKRTFRSKATLGVGALLTHKKLRCLTCGKYNQVGAAKAADRPVPKTFKEALAIGREQGKAKRAARKS